MSVWKREIFKWARQEPSIPLKHNIQPLVQLGEVDPENEALKNLHTAVLHGRKKQLAAVLQTGIWVDYPNSSGQTPLFVATLRGQYAIVEQLLQLGANPNEKSDTGMTPLHVACMKGSLRAVGAMLAAGGDLRLHDNMGNSCLDWAMVQPSARKRKRVIEFLQKSQLFALNFSGDFLGQGSTLERQPSILQMLRGKVGSQISLDLGHDAGLRRVHSHGYGRVYLEGDTVGGLVSIIPLVAENQMRVDSDGIAFESCSNFIFYSMLWNGTAVTVKRSDKRLAKETISDLLITEVEHISKLRHPNLLLLMGMCQASSFDSVMLLFERVYVGSLFHVLHDKNDHMPMTYIRDIMSQVCQAVLYLHAQSFIHCNITSHAIYLVSMHQAKIGNLEFMVEMKKAATGRAVAIAQNPHKEEFFRWMAPEILLGSAPSLLSDIYSLCSVMCEMITCEIPWKGKFEFYVIDQYTEGKGQAPIPNTVALFQDILSQGLSTDEGKRQANVDILLQQLQGPLDKPLGWKAESELDKVMTLQKEFKERISLTGSNNRIYTLSEQDGILKAQKLSETSSLSSVLSSKKETSAVESGVSTAVDKQRATASFDDSKDAKDSSNSMQGSDTTNNHSRCSQQRVSENSSSTLLSTVVGYQVDAVDGRQCRDKYGAGRHIRSYPTTMSLGRTKGLYLPRGMDILKYASERRSSSYSGLEHLQKYSRRTASLSWQGPTGVPRARPRTLSPNRSSRPHRKTQENEQELPVEASLLEHSCKTLPPVKPASHCTDVKEFVKGDHCSSPSLQSCNAGSMRNQISRRSLPNPRDRSPRPLSRTTAVSHSGLSEMINGASQSVELSMPGSVRTLTEQFQAHVYNHTLRQSILKGSMTPHGTVFDDVDISPTPLPLSLITDEIPLEDKKLDPDVINDKNLLTGSTKSSTESLTSVSTHEGDEDDEEESYPDDEDGQSYPVTSPKELDITEDSSCARSNPVYDLQPAEIKKLAGRKIASQNTEHLPSAHRLVCGDQDQTDGCQKRPFVGFEHLNLLQFLPASSTRTDVSSHPFDFEDYYIDDDYPGMTDGDQKQRLSPDSHKAFHRENSLDRSRQRHKDNGTSEEKTASAKYKNAHSTSTGNKKKNVGYTDHKNYEHYAAVLKSQEKTCEAQAVSKKFTNYRDKFLAGARKTESKQNSPSSQKTEGSYSYMKADEWLEEDLHLDLHLLKDKKKKSSHSQKYSDDDEPKQAHYAPSRALENKFEAHWPHGQQWIRNPMQRRSDPWLEELKEHIKREALKAASEKLDDEQVSTLKEGSSGPFKTTALSEETMYASENSETTTEEDKTYTAGKVQDNLDVAFEISKGGCESENSRADLYDSDQLGQAQVEETTSNKKQRNTEVCLETQIYYLTEQSLNEHAIDDDSTLERTPDDPDFHNSSNDLQDISNGFQDTSNEVLDTSSELQDGSNSLLHASNDTINDRGQTEATDETPNGHDTSNDYDPEHIEMTGDGEQEDSLQADNTASMIYIEADHPDSTFNMTAVTPFMPEDPLSRSTDPYNTTSVDSSMITVMDTSGADLLSTSENTTYEADKIVVDDDEHGDTDDGDGPRERRRCILLNLERNIPCTSDSKKTPREENQHNDGEGLGNCPAPDSTFRKFYLGSGTGCQGYSTTLRVESSLQKPGSHRIVHTACDSSTGVTQTVHEETLEAETLRTTMRIQ